MTQVAELNQFNHQTTIANGVNLHYVIGGEGEPVLLWHGFLETWYCWRKVMPALVEQCTMIVKTRIGSVATNVQGGTLEQCGHFIADERPDLLVERLFAFFEEVHQVRSSPALAECRG